MKSRTRSSFWRTYAMLDKCARAAARRAHRLCVESPMCMPSARDDCEAMLRTLVYGVHVEVVPA
jgi:hypothetical protein